MYHNRRVVTEPPSPNVPACPTPDCIRAWGLFHLRGWTAQGPWLNSVLDPFPCLRYRPQMPDDEKLTPADPDELAAALAFALKFEGRKRWHDADAFMANIVAERLVRYLERARYVVMKRPASGGHSAIGRGFEG